MTDLLDVGRLTVVTDTFAVQPSDSPNGELHHQAFLRPDGDRVLVVWNRTAAERVRVQFPAGMFRVVEYSLDGSTRTTPEERTVDVALTAGTPRIFRLTSK
jgi:hypothetical protein